MSATTVEMNDSYSSDASASVQLADGSSAGLTVMQHLSRTQETFLQAVKDNPDCMDLDEIMVISMFFQVTALYMHTRAERAKPAREEAEREEERKRLLYQRMKARQEREIRCASKGCEVVRTRNSKHQHKLDEVLTGRVARSKPLSPRQARQAQMREQYPPTYFRYARWQDRQRADKQQRRHEIQAERHPYARGTADEVWLGRIVQDLERATRRAKVVHTKRIETVRLPEGVRAIFRGNVGESILEIMHRTGSHAQIIPTQVSDTKNAVSGDGTTPESTAPSPPMRGFQQLTLWGSPAQNAAAIDLLPELAQALTADDLNASKNLKDYRLHTEETDRFGSLVERQPSSAQDEMDMLMERWHEEDADNDPANPSALDNTQVDRGDVLVDDAHRHDDEAVLRKPVQGETPTDVEEGNVAQDEPAVIRAVWTQDPLNKVRAMDRQLSSRQERMASIDANPISLTRRPIDSVPEFTAHVEDLVTCAPRLLRRKMDRSAGQYLPGLPQTHTVVAQTAAELTALFSDMTCMHYVSADAVDSAIRYLARHRDFPAVRRVVSALENNANYDLTTSNFDILLAAAAKEEDVDNFRYIVRLMLRRRVKPTWRTWVCLHGLVSRRFPPAAAADIENRMRARGVLQHPQAMRLMVANGVGAEFSAYLESQPDATLTEFVKLYDERYPADNLGDAISKRGYSARQQTAEQPRTWLTTSTANRIILILLKHGRTQDARDMVGTLEAAGERAKTDTLNTFLSSASRLRDAEAAVAALKLFEPMMRRWHQPVKLDQRSYEMLFHIVWRKRWYNMLRVIWRYACCAGCVSWEMQRRVKESLIAYVPAPSSFPIREERRLTEDERRVAREALGGSDLRKEMVAADEMVDKSNMTRTDVFFGWAGKFAVGVGDERLAFRQPPSDPMGMTEHERDVLALSAQPRSSEDSPTVQEDHQYDDKHHQRRRRLLTLLEADMGEMTSLRPAVPLVEMLEKAWQKDVRWKRRDLGVSVAAVSALEGQRAQAFANVFEEMLEHGIRVPMVAGRA
ncbi:hypothetical protein LTR85_010162 [Meristemomyces frigidus]|nr:hypothetical protein LTR85_010162 [Meristemomyces frigidus]